MTDPDNLIEAVARATVTYQVVPASPTGVLVWRVVSGAVVFGGDYSDRANAQNACDLLNAKAAILATLEGIREPSLDTFRAVLVQTDPTPKQFDIAAKIVERMALSPGIQRRKGNDVAAALVCDWQAMLTTLLASMKDPDNG